MRSIDQRIPFRKVLEEDRFISARLKPKAIKEALDYSTYLGVTPQLINMALDK